MGAYVRAITQPPRSFFRRRELPMFREIEGVALILFLSIMTRTRSGKSVTFEDKGEEVTSPVQRELPVPQRTRKRQKGLQGGLPPINTEPVETVGDTEQVENVVVGEQVENVVVVEQVENVVVGEQVENTGGRTEIEAEALGTSGATTSGAATGQPSGSAGGPTEAEAATQCLEYDSDDGVVVDTDILLGKDWKEHVGFALLKQHDRGIITCKQYTTSLKLWNLKDECDEFNARLIANPLFKLVQCSYGQANRVIVNAFLERWNPVTNTFHLPFGEMTITSDDVRYITGLPVDGMVVNYEFAKGENPITFVHEMLGIPIEAVAKELEHVGGLRVSKSWLKNSLAGKCGARSNQGESSSSGQTEAIVTVDQAVRGYLLYLLACTLMQDRSGDKININYLHFLRDLDKVGDWAWGAATLANLYRQLKKGSKNNTAGVSGYLTLLEAWVYEHFPKFRPQRNTNFIEGEMARTLKWKPVMGINVDVAMSALRHMREDLDLMEARDVVWDAYKKVRTVPENDVCWFYGYIRTLEIEEVYHPNRVVRQLGHVQSIPQPPIPPKVSNRSGKAYNVSHESRDDDFIHFANRLVNKEQRLGKARFDWECTPDYMTWYRGVAVRRLTGVKKKKQRDSREDEETKGKVLDAVRDAIATASKKTKKALVSVLQMAEEWMTSGTCTQHSVDDESDESSHLEAPRQKKKKKRSRAVKNT